MGFELPFPAFMITIQAFRYLIYLLFGSDFINLFKEGKTFTFCNISTKIHKY